MKYLSFFQENALFPHFSIQRNINFGTERNRMNGKKFLNPKKIIKILNIENILDKYPHQISAGEAQRASLTKAVISNPDLLLLDEPLSNIDEILRRKYKLNLNKFLKIIK